MAKESEGCSDELTAADYGVRQAVGMQVALDAVGTAKDAPRALPAKAWMPMEWVWCVTVYRVVDGAADESPMLKSVCTSSAQLSAAARLDGRGTAEAVTRRRMSESPNAAWKSLDRC